MKAGEVETKPSGLINFWRFTYSFLLVRARCRPIHVVFSLIHVEKAFSAFFIGFIIHVAKLRWRRRRKQMEFSHVPSQGKSYNERNYEKLKIHVAMKTFSERAELIMTFFTQNQC